MEVNYFEVVKKLLFGLVHRKMIHSMSFYVLKYNGLQTASEVIEVTEDNYFEVTEVTDIINWKMIPSMGFCILK